VFLSEKDVSSLEAALKMGYEEFTGTFCRWVSWFPEGTGENGTERLSLKEKPNYDCIFWVSEGGCSVYETRPLQCRAFPFWLSALNSGKSWEMTSEHCPGIGQGTLHSPESIEKWLVLRQNEPIISREFQTREFLTKEFIKKGES